MNKLFVFLLLSVVTILAAQEGSYSYSELSKTAQILPSPDDRLRS